MGKLADLHIHTYYSDSSSSPEEVVKQAVEAGLDCIAISDHDTIEGIAPTIDAAKDTGIEVVPAIELSSEYEGKEVHMLGYFIDHEDLDFVEHLRIMQESRVERIKEMVAKLKTLKVDDISFEEVRDLAQGKSIGRPHLAALLLKKKKVTSIKEAFDRYLAEGAPAYVPRFKLTVFEAIELIRKAGGVSVLAHPMVTGVDQLIPQLTRSGLNGIETYYPNNSEAMTNYYLGIAQKNNLLVTGGSDAHGNLKKNTWLGRVKVPYELVEKLKQAAKQ